MQSILKKFQNKNYTEALQELDKLLIRDPNSIEKLNLKGVILQILNKPVQARQNWEKATRINGNYFDPFFNLGNSFIDEKEYSKAEIYYEKAINCQPRNFKTYYQLGFLYMKKNDLQKAFNYFQKSKDYNSNFAPTYYNLGVVLNNLNKKEDSIIYLNEAIKIDPKYIDALFLLGINYREIKKYNLSRNYFLKVSELNPNYPYLKGAIRFIKNALCEWDDYEKDLIDLENDIKNKKKVATPWQGLSLFSSQAIQLSNTDLFIEKQQQQNFELVVKEKINVAYISANFCEHAVSNQLSEVLKLHDRSKFNIYGFYLGTKEDTKLKEIKKSLDKFFNVSQKETNQIIKLIKDLNVDIAVDLMGFTKANRYKIFDERCAPIQVSYLGYPGTTGLENMDYLIGDKNVVPDDYRKFFSEKIIYMPNSYMPNNENQIISKIKFTRKSEGLPEKAVVYCCFNKHYKITPKVFDVWINILKRVKNSVLWLNSAEESTQKNLLQYSKKNGINPKKIIFTTRTKNYSEYLSKHQLADIFLDTSPYSAQSTGCGSLIAGVPIITISGESFSNNVCASLLKAIGTRELICENLTEYENKAIELGKNHEELLNIKEKIKNNKIQKSLFDTKTYTKNLEEAFTAIYDLKKNKLEKKDLTIN